MKIQLADAISHILEQYDLLETEPITAVRESGDNLVYLIGTKDKKVLRISKRLPIEDVRFEHEALAHLARKSIPVPGWVMTKSGGLYASAPGAEVAVLFEFLEGQHIDTSEGRLPTLTQADAAGKMLGLIHSAGADLRRDLPRTRNIFSELERVIKNEDMFKKEFEGGADFVDQVKEMIAFGQANLEPSGLIHNDYRISNLFFKDGEVSGAVDFDWGCIGPIAKDLALGALEWSYLDGRRAGPEDALFDAFLKGYNSAAPKAYERGKFLYSWICFAALSDVCTYLCDRLSSDARPSIMSSYMYRKYLYFAKL